MPQKSETSKANVRRTVSDALFVSQWRRVDLYVQRAVLRMAASLASGNDHYHGLAVSPQEAEALLERPPSTGTAFAPLLSDEEEQIFADALNREESVISDDTPDGQTSRWERLVSTFELDTFEADVLMLCLLPDLDRRYQRLYGFLQDDITRKRPTIDLLLSLTGWEGPCRLDMLNRFAPSAILCDQQLLLQHGDQDASDRLDTAYMVPTSIRSWLLGNYRPDDDMQSWLCYQTCANEPSKIAISVDKALRYLDNSSGSLPLVGFYGQDQNAQQATALGLAAARGKGIIAIDMRELVSRATPGLLLRQALRDARMLNAIPVITHIDSCFNDGRPAKWAGTAMATCQSMIVTTGRERWYPVGTTHVRPVFHQEFQLPGYKERLALWRTELLDSRLKDPALDLTAAQFVLDSGQIRDAAKTAHDLAAAQGRAIALDDLFAAARAHSHHHLSKLAHFVEPRYSWDDIVLPEDQREMLREVVSAVRGKARVMEVWGVGKKLATSQGITVLFAGPPGTGKTMAAQIIAGELGLDLYKIDLSTVVSKYVGETEKNLEKIFAEAQTSNAVLFFDEADAIFGKRSEVKDAHDRYANIETSYLLQRMDAYDGVTMLATNLRANVDEAFTRRIQFAVDFYMPDEAHRLQIWQTLFPPAVPLAEDVDLSLLAERFKLAGGSIRNIIVSAVYQAAAGAGDGRVTMEHLLHGTRRELQKMGRLVDEQHLSFLS